MEVKEYQEYVKKGASDKYDKKLAIIGLVGEVGEVADVVKKESIYDDMSKFEEKYGMTVEEKIVDECGDIIWQLMNLLNQYDIPFEKILDTNVKKLNKRHGNQKVAKDGGERTSLL